MNPSCSNCSALKINSVVHHFLFKVFLLPGQGFALHRDDDDEDPEHSFPPHCGPLFVLERVVVPEPHVFVHDCHDPQLFQVQSTKKQN